MLVLLPFAFLLAARARAGSRARHGPSELDDPRRERHMPRLHVGLRREDDPAEHGRAPARSPRRDGAHGRRRRGRPGPLHDGRDERGPGIRRALSRAEGRARPEAPRGANHPQPFPEQHPVGLAERGGLPALALPRAAPRARLARADRRGAPHRAPVASLGSRHAAGRRGRPLAGLALPRLRHRVGRPRRAAPLRPRGTRRRARAGRPRRLGQPPPQLHPGPRAPRGPEAHRRGVAPPLRGARPGLPVPRRPRPRHPRGPRPPERGRGRAVHGGDPRLERPAGAARAPRQRDARRLLPLDRRGGGEPLPARRCAATSATPGKPGRSRSPRSRPPRARRSARCSRPRPSPLSPAATPSPRPRASRGSAPSGAGRCSATTRGTARTTRTGRRTPRCAGAGPTSSSTPPATSAERAWAAAGLVDRTTP